MTTPTSKPAHPAAHYHIRGLDHDDLLLLHDEWGDTARQLLRYMRFRAHRERQEHRLTLDFYLEHMFGGCRNFFGVVIGSHGGLKADSEQPELFKKWQAMKG
jgi:hypothetical protein